MCVCLQRSEHLSYPPFQQLAKNIRQLLRSSECHGCQWIHERQDWAELTLSAVCYLAGEVGGQFHDKPFVCLLESVVFLMSRVLSAVSSFAPLAHFIPLVDFRDRIDHWKWIGRC